MKKNLTENEEILLLENRELLAGFSESETVNHHLGSDDITGYEYILNDRTYTDVSSFNHGERIKLEENAEIRTDIYGSSVLWIYHEIPTFDSDDREWDSRAIRYLIFAGKEIDLIYMRGGYRIAMLKILKGLIYADKGLRKYLERLGFPTKDIEFR